MGVPARIGFLGLAFLAASGASGDPVTAGWSVGLACPPKGAEGTGALVASNSAGFTGGGTCQRVKGMFSKLIFTTAVGATLRSSTAYALQTPSVLVTPPLLTTEYQPVFSVATGCPVNPATTDLNWLFVQWTESERRGLTNTYLSGTATYSSTNGVTITGQYDIDGAPYWLGPRRMPGSCASGVYTVTDAQNLDIDGKIYFNAAGMGAFKTTAGRATFFFPRNPLTMSDDFGSQTLRGLSFDSYAGNGVGDVRPLRASSDAAGTTFVIQPLADPDTDTLDVSGTAYVDTLVFSPANVNVPADGMLHGTVTRTGDGAGSGNVACIGNNTDGDRMLLCSGESPSDNGVPFHFSLYAETRFNPASGPNNSVVAVTYDSGTNKIYIGGGFSSVGGYSRNGIARLNADGTVDPTFDPGTGFNNTVRKIQIVAGGTLYVGGDFASYRGIARNGIARINADGTLDTAFVPAGPSGNVNDLYFDSVSSKLYTTGSFSSVNIARRNTDGSIDTSYLVGTGFNATTFAFAYDSVTTKMYVAGGTFSDYNGTSVGNLVRLNNDGTLDTTFNTGTGGDGGVVTLAWDAVGNQLYAGGSFNSINGVISNGVARLSPAGVVDSTYAAAGLNSAVYSISYDAATSKLYAGGLFTNHNGTSANYIARLTSAGGLDSSFDPGTAFDASVSIVNFDATAGGLLTGGDFTTFNGSPRSRFALLTTTGAASGAITSSAGFNATARAVAFDATGRMAYFGGDFTRVNGVSRTRIARMHASGTLDTSFDPGTGFNGTVNALAFDDTSGKVYVGGAFTSFDGTGRNRIARLDTDGSLDTSFDPGSGFDGAVQALLFDAGSGKIYASGNFSDYGGTGRARIARLNADGTIDTTFDPGTGFDGDVTALAVDTATTGIFAGGDFANFNGTGRTRIARLQSNGALDTSFDPGTGFNGTVRALIVSNSGYLYAGGDFSQYNGTGSLFIAKVSTAGALVTSFTLPGNFNAGVSALALDPTGVALQVGGLFQIRGGTSARRIIRLNINGTIDTSFSSGAGFTAQVHGIAFDPQSGKMYVASSAVGYGGLAIGYAVRLTHGGAQD